MRSVIHKIKISLLFLLIAFSLNAKDIPTKPSTAVADYINLLSNSQKRTLEQRLKVFNDTSSMAIVLVIDDSTEGEDIFDYSYRMAEKWGVGAKGKDNGVLIYIAFNDKKIYIQTGSGLEGVLPDAILKRIIRNIIRPNFRKGNYYGGINGAINTIMGLVSGEFTADKFGKSNDDSILGYVLLFFFLGFFIFVAYSIYKCSKDDDCKNRGGGYHDGGRYNSGGGWIIGGGSGFGGGSSFGGGGGSSFGGFGGGGFSGGGAGGGW